MFLLLRPTLKPNWLKIKDLTTLYTFIALYLRKPTKSLWNRYGQSRRRPRIVFMSGLNFTHIITTVTWVLFMSTGASAPRCLTLSVSALRKWRRGGSTKWESTGSQGWPLISRPSKQHSTPVRLHSLSLWLTRFSSHHLDPENKQYIYHFFASTGVLTDYCI